MLRGRTRLEKSISTRERSAPCLRKQSKVCLLKIWPIIVVYYAGIAHNLHSQLSDRIFDLADELEQLVKENGGVENLSDDVKEEAVALAKQTKSLQIQYDDLVNGRPSQLLDMSIGE